MPYRVIEDFLPLMITQQIGRVSDAEILQKFEEDEKRMRTQILFGHRYSTVMDLTHMKPLEPTQREMYAMWIKRNEQALKQTILGTAFVVPNFLLRGAVIATMWLQKFPVPHRSFATAEEAIEYALGLLKAAHIDPPINLPTDINMLLVKLNLEAS